MSFFFYRRLKTATGGKIFSLRFYYNYNTVVNIYYSRWRSYLIIFVYNINEIIIEWFLRFVPLHSNTLKPFTISFNFKDKRKTTYLDAIKNLSISINKIFNFSKLFHLQLNYFHSSTSIIICLTSTSTFINQKLPTLTLSKLSTSVNIISSSACNVIF